METGYFTPQIIEVAVVGIFENFEVFFQGFLVVKKKNYLQMFNQFGK